MGRNAFIRLIADGEVLTSGVRRIRQSVDAGAVYRLEGYVGGEVVVVYESNLCRRL